MRKLGFLFGFVLLLGIATAAQAQETPKIEISGGYSFVRVKPQTTGAKSIDFNGGSGSVAYNLNHWLGVVADIGGYKASTTAGGSVFSYVFGPRLSYRAKPRYTPFAQVLFGGAHASSEVTVTPSSQNVFALSAGGGVDAKLTDHFALRVGQVEYLLTRFDEGPVKDKGQNGFRFTTGVVIRF